MEHAMSATALLRLLAALSVAQISYGVESPSCQITVLSAYPYQGLVLPNTTSQLNNAQQQINSTIVNPIFDDIVEALARIDLATEAAKNLKTQGIYLSRSYQAYATLAETLASQVGRQDVYLNYTRPVPEDIYSVACSQITYATNLYLQGLKDISQDQIRLRVLISENRPCSQLQLLQQCLSNQSMPQAFRNCLQSYVYNYKLLIRNITLQVGSHLKQLPPLDQCPYFAVLRHNIDDTVATAAYHVKLYAEEVLYDAGLSARALYEQNLNDINSSISLYNNITNLQPHVTTEINYANGNFISEFELTIRNYLSPIFKAAELGLLLYTTPEKIATFQTYITNAENLIQSSVANASLQLIPTRDTLVAINNILGNISGTLGPVLGDIDSCLPKNIDDYILKVNEYTICFNKSLSNLHSIIPEITNQFNTAVNQFQPNPDTKHNILQLLTDNYTYIKDYGKTTADEIFNLLGLTLDNSLSGQIWTNLTNDYANKVIQVTNSIQPVKLQLDNYTQTTYNRLDSDIAFALRPLEIAIRSIKKAIPGVDISYLNVTYNQLYADLKQNLINYINGINLNFTDSFNFGNIFNLTDQIAELKAKLISCIPQNVNFTVSFCNLGNLTTCFEPYVKNFTLLTNNTLASISTIAGGAESVKNTALNTIANYITLALQNATATTTAIAETALGKYGVTPDTSEQNAINQLVSFKQAVISPLVNFINQQITNLKTNNLTSMANLASSANFSVNPLTFAVNVSVTSNPVAASNVSSLYSFINQLINNTKNSIYSTLAPYKLDSVPIEAGLTNFTVLLNKTFSDYNSTAIANRCSNSNTTEQQYIACLNSVIQEAITFVNATLLPTLDGIVNQVTNLTQVANTNVSATITNQLNNLYQTAKTEGSKIMSSYNVTSDIVQQKALELLRNYNVTPIYNYAKQVSVTADLLIKKSNDTLNLGNYMISSSIYPVNDAIGSASYVTNWQYSFSDEKSFANSIIDLSKSKCLGLFPNLTLDINYLYAKAVNINATLDYQVSLLTPSKLSTVCPPSTIDYYVYYDCIISAVNRFGVYYSDALNAAYNASVAAHTIMENDTTILNSWINPVVTQEAAAVVLMLEPIAEQLLIDYGCTVDKLLGYATYLITQRYNQYKPNLTSLAISINSSVSNVLQTNQSAILDVRPSLLQLIQPLNQFIDLVKNSTNQTVLTADVLNAPSQFFTSGLAVYQIYLQNITTQAYVIRNNTNAYIANMEIRYQGLNYTSIYNKCYNSTNENPLLKLVACYNRLHYEFYMYLDNAQTQMKAYLILITDLDVNVTVVITTYVNNTMLVKFKSDVWSYTANLYVVAGLQVPLELQPYLPKNACKVEVIVNGQPTCIIYY